MTDIRGKISEIYSLEQLAGGGTFIHRLHPLCKITATLVFIVTIVSFDRHALGGLVPYIFYPVILMPLSETPYSLLLKRGLIALPFCLFIGVSNLIYDGNAAAFFALLYRTYLCVMAVLILVSVTPLTQLTAQLRALKIPNIFVVMLEMTYRYIGVLADEAASMYTAYSLRARGKGVDIRHAGGFAGSLLLRSFDRAERIYSAMKCRGYTLSNPPRVKKKFRPADIVYIVAVCAPCVFFRIFDIGVLWSK